MCFILFLAKKIEKEFSTHLSNKTQTVCQYHDHFLQNINFEQNIRVVCLFLIAKVNRTLLIEFMLKLNDTSTHKNKFNHGKIVKFCTLVQNLTIPPKMELRTFC